MPFYQRVIAGIAVLFSCLLFSAPAGAQTLYEMLEKVVSEHDLVHAAQAGKEAAAQGVRQARGERYPHLTGTANIGKEYIDRPGVEDSTRETRNYQSLQARQLLFDFGQTGSGEARARAGLDRSAAALAHARQDIIRRGIHAYLDVYRYARRLELARKSEKRIVELTGMEETRVNREAGLASDVLQAKSQLAGAKALRVRAEGNLNNAMHTFRAVFGQGLSDEEITAMVVPPKPADVIPSTLDDALARAEQNSLDLYMAATDIDRAGHEIRFRQSRYFPRLHLVGELKRREDDEGIPGVRKDALGMVELTWEVFSGGKNMAAVSEAKHARLELESQKKNIERRVAERVSIAWQNLVTSRENARYLHDQAAILEDFLVLAKHERRLSTRSLIDVLNGELTYLNALSNAISADIDHDLAVYNMLYAMGLLEMDILR